MDSSTGSNSDFAFTSDADFPNKVKLRKRIPIWLLEFTLGLDHDRLRHTLRPACTVRDKYLKGELNINVVDKRLEYRKECGIPWIGEVVLNAGVNYRNPLKAPRIGLNFSTCGAAAVVSGDAMSFDQRLPLGKRVSLEFVGEIRRTRTGIHQRHDLSDQSFTNLHLNEINAIIKL